MNTSRDILSCPVLRDKKTEHKIGTNDATDSDFSVLPWCASYLPESTLLDDCNPEKINFATFLQLVELVCHVTQKTKCLFDAILERDQHHLIK